MEKRSVNLIIQKSKESPLFIKLKLMLPIVATVSLSLFVIFFLSSIIYINRNNSEFNASKTQIENLEKKISGNKNTEGIYTLTVSRIKTISQLGSGNKNYALLLFNVMKLESNGVNITQTSIDKKNNVTMAVSASSSAALDEFVTNVGKTESENLFSEIRSSGVVRDKNGGYIMTISLKPNSKILQ